MSNTERREIKHYPQQQFAVQGKDLLIAGRSVVDIKREIGSSGPLFLYDLGVVRENVERLREALPARINLSYAVKANPNAEVVAALAGTVHGLDVASLAELEQAVSLGIDATRISFAGPGKSEAELARAVEAGVIINVESQTELQRCIELAKNKGKRPTVCLRVNPMVEVRSSGMKMGGAGSPFGIEAGQVPAMLETFPHDHLDLLGFHVFACSQILSAVHLNEYYDEVFRLLAGFQQFLNQPMRLLNLGGGFGIPYFPGDCPLDVKAVGDHLAMLFETNSGMLVNAEIRMEFGRYLVGNAGIYVTEVSDIKQCGDKTFVVVNGGMHHHLANSGNLGQVVRRNYDVVVANKMDESTGSVVTIVGPLCTPLDIVAHQVAVPELALGDLVAVLNSGAYALTASPNGFLSHPAPAEVVL